MSWRDRFHLPRGASARATPLPQAPELGRVGYAERHVLDGFPPMRLDQSKLTWADGDPGMGTGVLSALGGKLGKFMRGFMPRD